MLAALGSPCIFVYVFGAQVFAPKQHPVHPVRRLVATRQAERTVRAPFLREALVCCPRSPRRRCVQYRPLARFGNNGKAVCSCRPSSSSTERFSRSASFYSHQISSRNKGNISVRQIVVRAPVIFIYYCFGIVHCRNFGNNDIGSVPSGAFNGLVHLEILCVPSVLPPPSFPLGRARARAVANGVPSILVCRPGFCSLRCVTSVWVQRRVVLGGGA